MTFHEFENRVSMAMDNLHFAEFRTELQGIRDIFMERFLSTLAMGFTIPETAKHIATAARLPDANYARYIKFMASRTNFASAVTDNMLQAAI